jgi:hypothetical protein
VCLADADGCGWVEHPTDAQSRLSVSCEAFRHLRWSVEGARVDVIYDILYTPTLESRSRVQVVTLMCDDSLMVRVSGRTAMVCLVPTSRFSVSVILGLCLVPRDAITEFLVRYTRSTGGTVK